MCAYIKNIFFKYSEIKYLVLIKLSGISGIKKALGKEL